MARAQNVAVIPNLEIVLGEVIGDNAMVGNIRHERPVHAVCFLRL